MPAARSRTLPRRRAGRRLSLLLATGLVAAALTSCTSDSQASQDAYKVGCPALDAAVAGGSVVNQAAVRALEAARDSGQLDPQPLTWVETAISVLTSSDPNDIPADAKKLLVDGCADHGYPLRNLS